LLCFLLLPLLPSPPPNHHPNPPSPTPSTHTPTHPLRLLQPHHRQRKQLRRPLQTQPPQKPTLTSILCQDLPQQVPDSVWGVCVCVCVCVCVGGGV
jgi:hypothetical protein